MTKPYRTCTRCKEEKLLSEFYFKKTQNKFCSWCKSCCKEVASARHRGIVLRVEKSPEEYVLNCGLYRLDGNIRSGCYTKQRRGKQCEKTLHIKDLRKLYHDQLGKCYYTGILMKVVSDVKRDPYLMSLDRINPTRGYVEGNVVLCCLGMNWLKNTHSEDVLFNSLKDFYKGATAIGKINSWEVQHSTPIKETNNTPSFSILIISPVQKESPRQDWLSLALGPSTLWHWWEGLFNDGVSALFSHCCSARPSKLSNPSKGFY